MGLDAMEVLSDTDMRSYGWCFEVDGKVPESYPDSIPLKGVKKITWFYAYAEYVKGEWISQCKPSYQLKSPYVCPVKASTR